jgi:3-oxoacyl-[acyl-carrier protein] reductase
LAINLPADVIKELEAESTVGHRLGTVDDIAQVAAFLAEENSRWVNGDTISATGGGYMF